MLLLVRLSEATAAFKYLSIDLKNEVLIMQPISSKLNILEHFSLDNSLGELSILCF